MSVVRFRPQAHQLVRHPEAQWTAKSAGPQCFPGARGSERATAVASCSVRWRPYTRSSMRVPSSLMSSATMSRGTAASTIRFEIVRRRSYGEHGAISARRHASWRSRRTFANGTDRDLDRSPDRTVGTHTASWPVQVRFRTGPPAQSGQLFHQRRCFPEVCRIKSFGEPRVHTRQ